MTEETSILFTEQPTSRRGYSDRTAAFLAKLSGLAYIKFEEVEEDYANHVLKTVKEKAGSEATKTLLEFLKPSQLMSYTANRGQLLEELEKLGMVLVKDFDQPATHTQAFIARVGDESEGHPLGKKVAVLSFRGSESLIYDWATNFSIGDVRMICGLHEFQIHYGFLRAFKSVQKDIETELKKLIDEGYILYITGHSLGGALALIATHQLGRKKVEYTAGNDFPEKGKYPGKSRLVGERIAGCYSFGAPRVAGIGFEQSIKSPYYRIVHADDPVPRVPPVYGPSLLIWLQKLFTFIPPAKLIAPGILRILALVPAAINIIFKSKIGVSITLTADVISIASQFVHHGDTRYIKRKTKGQPLTVISNPDLIVRLKEFCRHGLNRKAKIVKDHAIVVYCELLESYAEQRKGENQ